MLINGKKGVFMKKTTSFAVITAIAAGLAFFTLHGCGTSGSGGVKITGDMNINYGEYHQEIDGFGGSNAWNKAISDPDAAKKAATLLFSKTEGAGFTILRNRIPFRERLQSDEIPGYDDGFIERKDDNTYVYTTNANGTKSFKLNWNSFDVKGTKALISDIKDLGADGPEKLTIMSTPWTPPNNRVTQWKEDVAGVNSRMDYKMVWSKPDVWGRLKKDKYEDYADLLADYVNNFETVMGHPLAILSVQNEPNWKVDYESAYWSGQDLKDFLKVIARRFPMKGIALGENGLGIMIPEFENFNINFNNMIKPSLDDPESEKILSHIGLHQYNGANDSSSWAGAKEFPEITASGKRFWQTEVSGSGQYLPYGTGIDNALYYARMIHFDMTRARTNAFLFWWLWTGSETSFTSGSLLFVDYDTVTAATRLYAMGQYSRFIRPGWYRIDCDATPIRNVYASAYRNPNSDEIAIVIINDTMASATVNINLNGGEFSSLDRWRTSAAENLKSLGKQMFSRNASKVSLPPKSITTFYGRVK